MQLDLDQLYKNFTGYIDDYLSPERAEAVKAMYDDIGERLFLAPASSVESYHNAFPGGYLDHVVRVADFSLQVYKLYESMALDVSDFTVENLIFTALHHDLGKLGFPGEGRENYIVNDSEWHRSKLGQVYKPNEKNPFTLVQDQSLFLLQYYAVPMSWAEFITIRIHDGLYDDGNKPYYISRSDQAKLRTNLPFILHTADLMAARFEYERWKQSKNSITSPAPVAPKIKKSGGNKSTLKTDVEFDASKAFASLFGTNS